MNTNNEMNLNKLYSVMIDSVDFCDIGLCNCDTNGEIQYLNQSFINIFSIRGKPEAFAGKNIKVLVEEFNQIVGILESNKNERGVEFSITRETGKCLIIDCHSVKETKTGVESLLYIVRDITFYKKLEVELLKADKIFTSLVQSTEDIIYRLDANGNILFISESISKYGYKPEELAGVNILEIVHPDDREKAAFKLNERRSGDRKTTLFEVRLFCRDGGDGVEYEFESRSDVLSQFFLITAEGLYLTDASCQNCFIGTQGVARDITKRRHIEVKLKETENKWHEILNTLEDGYYEVDLTGNFTFANNSLTEIIGQTPETVCGKNFADIFTFEDSRAIYKVFNNLYKTGVPVKMVDLVITRKDAKKRKVEGSISLIRSENGEPLGFRGIMRDITDKNRMQQELARAKKLEAIGILAGGIAHDFNNALTAIMGNLSLARMEIPKENSGLCEIIDDAEAASVKIMDLTKKLSTFARGGRPIKKTLSIVDLLYEISGFLFSGYKGEFRMNIQENLKPVDIDEMQINHALENIIKNSLEAVNNCGRITISAENIKNDELISHHEIALQPGEYVMIAIEDNGPGIDPENTGKIFDPYYSTKETGGGMGLATSFAIIKRHHGYIDVRSKVNEGTGFYIYLPVHSD